MRFFADWDFAGSERELRRALQLNPGYVTAHHWYAYWLAGRGPFRREPSPRSAARERSIRPPLVMNRDVGHILLYSRRYDEAIEQLRQTLAMDPGFHQTRSVPGRGAGGRRPLRRGGSPSFRSCPPPHDDLGFRMQEASDRGAGGPTRAAPRAARPRSRPRREDDGLHRGRRRLDERAPRGTTTGRSSFSSGPTAAGTSTWSSSTPTRRSTPCAPTRASPSSSAASASRRPEPSSYPVE